MIHLPAMLAALCLGAAPALAQEEVTFAAADGVVVHADRYGHEGNRSRGVLLLFHQAGGSAWEYREIAPRLAAEGFDALAVDLRIGGSMGGQANRTLAALAGPVMAFDDVMPDLRAALSYARAEWPGEPVLLWGSSYSADLAIALGAERPEGVLAVLAFSPGDTLRATSVVDAAGRLAVPLFVTHATAEDERALAERIAEAAGPLATLDEPASGRHGSVTLLRGFNPAGWEAEWAAVEAFLDRVAP